jgi:cellulose synthase/poly-beta-1,6-N-acetylglucosamine synthase-like glycosyltransferase
MVRLGLIVLGACVQKRRSRRRRPSGWRPAAGVAVLVPAYNEETVICKTVETLLASTLEADIIVIDDGSSDRTSDVVRETYAGVERVKVHRKENGGKAAALNYGIAQTDAEVIVAIDGDTVLLPDAIERLVEPFEDPRVGAVAGKVVVGNRVNLMTRFQALEYLMSQNLDRRAFELFNAIGVVPGAIGAWRRRALVEVGGYSHDTLAEDADLTISIERRGWRVLGEPAAVALTEAPESLGSFLKQRFRWMFGTLQVAYKHAGAVLGRPSGVSLIIIPNVILFQFAFTLLAPIMDLLLVWTVATNVRSLVVHGWVQADTPMMLLGYWAFFQTVDVAAAAAAVALDGGRPSWRLVPLLAAQRFTYRQLLYWVAGRTLLAAIKGSFVGWGKLIRTGSVSLPVQTKGAG